VCPGFYSLVLLDLDSNQPEDEEQYVMKRIITIQVLPKKIFDKKTATPLPETFEV
jgi:hypothetical protein